MSNEPKLRKDGDEELTAPLSRHRRKQRVIPAPPSKSKTGERDSGPRRVVSSSPEPEPPDICKLSLNGTSLESYVNLKAIKLFSEVKEYFPIRPECF